MFMSEVLAVSTEEEVLHPKRFLQRSRFCISGGFYRRAEAVSDHHKVLKCCKPPTNATRTRYNVILSGVTRRQQMSSRSTLPIGTRCCSSFMMMKTFSLRKNGTRQSMRGLRHARRQLKERGPNISIGCWLKLYERYKREG